jgi:hypothetical protein
MTRTDADLVAVRELADEMAGAGPEPSLARAWYRIGNRQRPRRRLPRLLVPIGSALAVTLVAALAAVYIGGSGGSPVLPGNDPTIPVSQAWAQLIAAGRSATTPSIVDGQVLYVHTDAVGYAIYTNGTAWQPMDQTNSRWYDIPTMRLLRMSPSNGLPEGPGAPTGPPSLGNPTAAWLASLPTDPDALRDALLAAAASGAGDWSVRHGLWEEVWQLFSQLDLVVPVALRVALYQVLSEESSEAATRVTLDGRSLVAITRVERDDGQQLLFDAATGRCVGHRSLYLGHDAPGAPANGVRSWSIWDQGLVPAVGATP